MVEIPSPTPPSTVNRGAETASKIISGLNSAGAKIVYALVIADFPWLGFPIIRTLFRYSLGFLAYYLSKAETVGATFIIIDNQIVTEQTFMTAAIARLLVAQKSGDADAIKKAIQDYANAQSALIRDDGSLRP